MAGFGWRWEFKEKTWAEVRTLEADLWSDGTHRAYLMQIVDSVLASSWTSALAVTTSMHDLVVVSRPVPEPPMDVLVVRAPGSLHPPPDGFVAIEYVRVSNRNTRIERPAVDAVRLFWRFVAEEFGMGPAQP